MIAFAFRAAILGALYGLTASLAIAAIAHLIPRDDNDQGWKGDNGD